MNKQEFDNLTSDELKKYINKHNEKDYVLIDVRQDFEYTKGHIPGANHIPLGDLESNLFGLPADRDMIFYCHSGGRSLAAADLASESEISGKKIYNLLGGIMAWKGKKLKDLPRVQIFDKTEKTDKILLTAMDLEKGAWRFYNYILNKFALKPFNDIIKNLLKEEKIHAQKVYFFWAKNEKSSLSFDELFTSLRGEILEGGENFNDIIQRIDQTEENPCINLLELSLHIEYSAFDLYRTIAEKTADKRAKDVFLSIAQAEKAHMKTIAKSITECPMS
jgi:rhodanese-related sulfurtransferase/rubrerythrin